MNLYFDTEFTGLHARTTLISIGIENDNEDFFYAELTDYDKKSIADNEWMQKNVINNLHYNDMETFHECENNSIGMKGTKLQVREALIKWIGEEDIQFISDVSHYDFVLLVDLLADDALSLPKNITPSCHDINQDIAAFFQISEKEAFDKSRSELAGADSSGVHNALKDANDIRKIYYKMQGDKKFVS